MAGDRGYSRAEYRFVVDGHARAAAYGELDWQIVNGSPQARIPVTADGFEDGDLSVNIKVPSGRPEQPTVSLLIRGRCAIRLDVNGDHGAGESGVRATTHWQRAETSDEVLRPRFEMCDDAPEVPMTGPVTAWAYREVLWWVLDRLHINRQGVLWVDPGEGEWSR